MISDQILRTQRGLDYLIGMDGAGAPKRIHMRVTRGSTIIV